MEVETTNQIISLARIVDATNKAGWWLEHEWSIFPLILGISSSQLTNSIIFSGVQTTNQKDMGHL